MLKIFKSNLLVMFFKSKKIRFPKLSEFSIFKAAVATVLTILIFSVKKKFSKSV